METMNSLTDDIKLQERTCAYYKCSCKFKVMEKSLQKYCSTDCIVFDNNLTGREKIHLGSWVKLNPDKTKLLKEKLA